MFTDTWTSTGVDRMLTGKDFPIEWFATNEDLMRQAMEIHEHVKSDMLNLIPLWHFHCLDTLSNPEAYFDLPWPIWQRFMERTKRVTWIVLNLHSFGPFDQRADQSDWDSWLVLNMSMDSHHPVHVSLLEWAYSGSTHKQSMDQDLMGAMEYLENQWHLKFVCG